MFASDPHKLSYDNVKYWTYYSSCTYRTPQTLSLIILEVSCKVTCSSEDQLVSSQIHLEETKIRLRRKAADQFHHSELNSDPKCNNALFGPDNFLTKHEHVLMSLDEWMTNILSRYQACIREEERHVQLYSKPGSQTPCYGSHIGYIKNPAL